MSRVLSLFARLPTLPAKMTETVHWTPLRALTDLIANGAIHRDLFVGGSEIVGIPGDATGDVTLVDFVPWSVDNTSAQISGFSTANGGTLVVQVTFLVRVSNAAITVTPKILYGSTRGSIGSTATISGAVACSATDSDYSGTNQIQTVTLTLPSGLKYFAPKLTIAGTVAAGYQVWGRAFYSAYVSLP